MSSRAIDTIVVHCSDTPAHLNIGAKDIDRWHRAKGWMMIGYHIVIRRDGTVEYGRPLERVGAHVQGHNATSIGICMVGGPNENGDPMGNFLPEQFKALREKIFDLSQDYPIKDVLGHRDFPGVAKECPCFDVRAWMSLMPEDPRQRL